ncbi:MAG: AAA family ATPase [Pleurocapsa minor HA4230-MV1]|jgi:predicted ABC-type ATPase|nr:AAA family ATPase [Pleurocapsa minor HA4230-MV1]
MPEIFVFSGCNGSGKTTLATRILASLNPSPEFVNADIIAAQLNPNDVDAAAIAQCDDDGNVIIIQPEDITPLAEKIKQRQGQTVPKN